MIGTGMGTTSGGALNLMHAADFWWLNGKLFEVEMARVLQETGIVGFILVYAARVWLLIKAIRLGTRFRNPLYVGTQWSYRLSVFARHGLGFVVNNATVGIYHWFAGDCCLPCIASKSRNRSGRTNELCMLTALLRHTRMNAPSMR